MKHEVKDFDRPCIHTKLSSVYAGIEAQKKQINRDIEGLTDLFMRRNIGTLTLIGVIKGNRLKTSITQGFCQEKQCSEKCSNIRSD